MNSQKVVKVIASNKDNGQLLSGMAIMIKLKMKLKNNYNIGPKITNESGFVVFTRTEIEEEIEATRKGSPMDYFGGLECCKSVEAIVMGHEAIQRLVKAREIWGAASSRWKLSNEMLQALLNAISQNQEMESVRFETEFFGRDIVIQVPL
jgi:hypothetical protein